MSKALIRPHENAYPLPPFFHLSHKTSWAIPYYFTAALILTLSSIFFYGYGALVHTLIILAAGAVIAPILSIFKKNLFFHSLLWKADLLILAAMLPPSLPWFTGLIAAPLFIIGARILFVPEIKPLFQPHLLVLIFLLHAFGHPPISSPTVFHLMPDLSLNSWLEASRLLFLEDPKPLRDLPFFIGGRGGSLILIFILGVFLSAARSLSFSLALIYFAGQALWFFLFSALSGRPLAASENFNLPEIFFIGFFIVQNPAPLEYPKKLLHAFSAASFTAFLSFTHTLLPLYYGVLAANLISPLWDILPEAWALGGGKKIKTPRPRGGSFLSAALALALMGAACLFARNS